MPIKRMYNWVVSWADTRSGAIALFLLAFCESSFFPIPPDVLLIALAVAVPKKSLKYALICSVGSVLGGWVGYAIGWHFMAVIGSKIISFYDLTHKFQYIETLYKQYDAWVVFTAGFTPLPYKLITISAGLFNINFLIFTIASLISRSARFFIVGGLIYIFGSKIQFFIEKYFNLLAIAFTFLLIAGFAVLKFLI